MRYQGLPNRGLLIYGPHAWVRIAGVARMALLDTGARYSAVDEDLLRFLALEPVGLEPVSGATGAEARPTFDVDVTLPELGLVVPKPVRSLALATNQHYWRAIIGRDVLDSCELTINWRDETISIERLA